MFDNIVGFGHPLLHVSLKTLVRPWNILDKHLLATWAEFFIGLVISGLRIFGLRPLQSKNNNNKDSTYFTSYRQARKAVKFKVHCVKFKINACMCYIPLGLWKLCFQVIFE